MRITRINRTIFTTKESLERDRSILNNLETLLALDPEVIIERILSLTTSTTDNLREIKYKILN